MGSIKNLVSDMGSLSFFKQVLTMFAYTQLGGPKKF